MIRSIWLPWWNETGATATNPKMMSQQRIGSGSSRRYWCKRSGCERVMQGWWGAPGFRVPTGRRHGKRGTSKDNSDMVQTYGTSHTCKGISSRSSRVMPSKRAFSGRTSLVQCRGNRRSRIGRSGSSCSRRR